MPVSAGCAEVGDETRTGRDQLKLTGIAAAGLISGVSIERKGHSAPHGRGVALDARELSDA
jgi:hypothetical protein